MKITACNLRSIGKEKTIDVYEKIVLSGVNGAGKSTMAKTPYFVLTGKGLSIKNGCEEGYGEIEFAGITIMRQKKKNGTTIRVNGKVCSETAMYEHLNKIGYNPEALCALFDTETTLDGETMLKVASMKLDIDKIISFTGLEGDERDILVKYFNDNDIEVVTIPAINKAHNRFYSERTDINRNIKRLRTLVENDEPFAKVQPIDVVQQVQLNASLVDKQSKLVREIATAETIHRNTEKLRKQVEAWKTEKMLLEASDCPYSQKDVENAEKKISEYEKESSELTSIISELNKEILLLTERLSNIKIKKSGIQTKLQEKRKTISTLENTKVCPLYAGVCCTTNMSVVIDTLQSEIADLQIQLHNIENDEIDETVAIDDRKQRLDEARSKLSTNGVKLHEEKTALGKMQKALSDFALISGKIAEIGKNISKNTDELNNVVLPDIDALNQTLNNVREQIRTVEKNLVDASQISDAANRLTQNQNALDIEEQKSARYTSIVSALKVLPNKIFEQVFKPIEKGINAILAEIKNDWSITFNFNGNGIDIFIITPDGNINLNELSTGERIVINYVFKVLICKLIKFDTIVLDNTDALDVINYNMVENVVEKSPYKTLLINCGEINSQFQVIKM